MWLAISSVFWYVICGICVFHGSDGAECNWYVKVLRTSQRKHRLPGEESYSEGEGKWSWWFVTLGKLMGVMSGKWMFSDVGKVWFCGSIESCHMVLSELCLLKWITSPSCYSWPFDIGGQYSGFIYTARFIVWQPHRAAETLTNWWQSLFCCFTVSVEQAAGGAETAAVAGLVSSWSENISV